MVNKFNGLCEWVRDVRFVFVILVLHNAVPCHSENSAP
jgi:hypothetical protein